MIEVKELTVTDMNEELENVCYTLYSYKMKNVDAFYDFNGTKIFSRDITGLDAIDRMFKKVYGCSYDDYVTKKANEMKPIWLEKGYKLISPDKHKKWEEFVNVTIENISFYHVGNPIGDTLTLISKINEVSDSEELKKILISLDGSNNILVQTAINFSKHDEELTHLYEEIRQTSRK